MWKAIIKGGVDMEVINPGDAWSHVGAFVLDLNVFLNENYIRRRTRSAFVIYDMTRTTIINIIIIIIHMYVSTINGKWFSNVK